MSPEPKASEAPAASIESPRKPHSRWLPNHPQGKHWCLPPGTSQQEPLCNNAGSAAPRRAAQHCPYLLRPPCQQRVPGESVLLGVRVEAARHTLEAVHRLAYKPFHDASGAVTICDVVAQCRKTVRLAALLHFRELF